MIVAEDFISASRAFSLAHRLFSLRQAIHTGEGVILKGIGHSGLITLLNAQGLKVDGVSYTQAQAQREGWTVVF